MYDNRVGDGNISLNAFPQVKFLFAHRFEYRSS